MSADNGIYILRMANGENRVIHAQAIENIFFDKDPDTEFNYAYLYDYFHEAEPKMNLDDAYELATKMYNDIKFVEYGIKPITCKQIWKEICYKAKDKIDEKIKCLSNNTAITKRNQKNTESEIQYFKKLRESVVNELLEFREPSIYEIRPIIKKWKREACRNDYTKNSTVYADINGKNLTIYTTIPGILIGLRGNLFDKYKKILKEHRINEIKLQELDRESFVW